MGLELGLGLGLGLELLALPSSDAAHIERARRGASVRTIGSRLTWLRLGSGLGSQG